jgi:hypothetical protein
VLYSWVRVEEPGLKEFTLELAELAVDDSLGLDPPGAAEAPVLLLSSFTEVFPVSLWVIGSVSMSSSALSTRLA